MKTKRFNQFLIVFLFLIITTGCSSLKVTTRGAVPVSNQNGEIETFKTIHVVVGTIKTWDEDLCNGAPLAEVSYYPNFLYSLANVVTLGIWKPMKVSYKCNEDCNQ